MHISLNWIGRYVDIADLDPHKVADDLTLSTAEIEGVEAWGQALEKVVVGHVAECAPHPDSDHLSLTRIDDGSGEPVPVVCGAPNIAAGQKIAFARVGVTLPGGVKLKKTKIRGEPSLGMCLSEREMELSDAHEGILVLDTDAAPGTALTEVLPVRDTILEIDNKSITHRPDLWGHYGFARELAALYNRPLRPAVGPLDFPTEGRSVPVTIDDTALCKRYLGLVIEGIEVGPAPDWMRYLLTAVGQRPISNVVDLTNFILLDLGQPMHAFDLDRLRGPAIRVRRAAEGERITTLDEEERTLTAEDLLITDDGGPVALAGVMGGLESEIGDATRTLFLESANFDAATVRRTSARLGLRSESSARFEKSLDPELTLTATRKFVTLLREMSPGITVAGPLTDAGGWSFPGRTVGLRRERVALKLGLEIPDTRIAEILESLHFDLTPDGAGWQVGVPSFRATKDIAIEDDLIEEVGRIYRYGNIPPRTQTGPVAVPWSDPELVLDRKVRRILAYELGLQEAYNYTFITDELVDRLGLGADPFLRVVNPVAENFARLRRHVLPSLLDSLALNLRHRDEVRLFELGKGYHPENRDGKGQPHEVREAAGFVARRHGDSLLYTVKGMIEHLAWSLELPTLDFEVAPAEAIPPFMHPSRCFTLGVGASRLGLVGDLHPGAARRLEAVGECTLFTLDLRAILATGTAERKYVPLPLYPPILVDVAVVVPEETRVATLVETLRRAGKKLVAGVELFDIYRGENLGAGRKSLAFHVTLQSREQTLGDKDEKKFLDRARKLLPEVGAEIRG